MSVVLAKCKYNKNYKKIQKCQYLIVDEISMISADFLEKMDAVLKYIRQNTQPFGGLNVIFVGDFLQLPPVIKPSSSEQKNHSVPPPPSNAVFAFQSKAWQNAHVKTICLQTIKRQKDPVFIELLNEIRLGKCSPSSEAILLSRHMADMTDSDEEIPIEPTR